MTPNHTAVVDAAALCPYCLQPLRPDETWQPCPACHQGHHLECWEELGGCAVYGCSLMVPLQKPTEIENFWGATEKQCPMCAETIAVAEIVCPYCHARFDDIKPMTREDMLDRDSTPKTPIRKTAVWMLVLSVLGVTSPLVLIVGGWWYLAARKEIREETTTRALALVALAVSGLYIVLVGFGLLAFGLRGPVTGTAP